MRFVCEEKNGSDCWRFDCSADVGLQRRLQLVLVLVHVDARDSRLDGFDFGSSVAARRIGRDHTVDGRRGVEWRAFLAIGIE